MFDESESYSGRYPLLDVAAERSSSPRLLDTLFEGVRTMSEAALLSVTWGYLHRSSRNTRQAKPNLPVMVLPGFMGGDASTAILRSFLSSLGYKAHPWLLGTNDGTERIQNALLRRFKRLRQHYDQPIALVGHSLGGVFARELGREFPQDVAQVITLGSPFGITDVNAVNPLVRRLFEHVSGDSVENRRAQLLQSDPSHPIGIPCTSVFSRTDGVVHWQTCLEKKTPLTQNVEVWGSHCGLVVNPSVLHVVADRLAQQGSQHESASSTDQHWQLFDFSSQARQAMYPKGQAHYA